MRKPVLLSLFLLSIALTLFAAPSVLAQDASWDLMTQSEMGLDRFHADHPGFDGKGVVIAVLDTGVDMGVEGLKELPGGGVKVVDVRDFSGEGDLFWEEGRVVPDGAKGEKIVDSKGRSLKNFGKKAAGALDGRYFLAFLEEKKFRDTSVKDLNGDGDTKDSFGILIFVVKEGEAFRYEAVVDLNGDGDLGDGVRLTDYWRRHETFTLKGKKGGRRQLTMALNFYPEEKRLSVHFDDGGHGTHVAGIAAGYSVDGQKGYNGGAPGAKIISLKIGNNRYAGGCTTTESMKKAYEYAAKYAKEHKVPVVCNMSFGIGSEIEGKSAIDLFLDDFLWKNPTVTAVVSNGNEGPGLSSTGTPAASRRAISVGALLSPAAASAQYGVPHLEKEVLFSFSSRGGDVFKPDVLAPGSACSTVPPWNDHDLMQGTSMASPSATGAVACLVDALARHDPPYPIDNAIILRAVKNTGRHIDGWTVADEGGGVIDVPAAYEYALSLMKGGEEKVLREYEVINRGPAPGQGVAYWRMSPYSPKPVEVMSFQVKAGFPKKMTAEEKAGFYRAFDLSTDADWLSINKKICYLKGSQSALVGVLADVAGKEPGLYTGRVLAARRGEERIGKKPVPEFAIPVTVAVPFRVTPENRGRIQASGAVDPGFLKRFFVEVPPGITEIRGDLRILEDGGAGARLSVIAHDPEGVGRGGAGASGKGSREGALDIAGTSVIPGTWEFDVNSSIRSPATASFDLVVTLSGLDVGDTDLSFGADTARTHVLVPVRCTQARPFSGILSGRIDSFVKREMVEVKGTDLFTRTVRLDSATASASWTVEFDRRTFCLFTDCVLRLEDPATGATIRNSGLTQRTGSVGLPVPGGQSAAKEYKLVLRPAFTRKGDEKSWRFILTERLTWRTGAVFLEPVSPKNGRFSLEPYGWAKAEFLLSSPPPLPPAGYLLDGFLEAKEGRTGITVARKRFVRRPAR